MRIYNRVALDSQRRVYLGGFIDCNSSVVVYMERGSDAIYIEIFDEYDDSVPQYAIRKVDAKSRVALPKWMLKESGTFDITVECEGDPKRISRIVLVPSTT